MPVDVQEALSEIAQANQLENRRTFWKDYFSSLLETPVEIDKFLSVEETNEVLEKARKKIEEKSEGEEEKKYPDILALLEELGKVEQETKENTDEKVILLYPGCEITGGLVFTFSDVWKMLKKEGERFIDTDKLFFVKEGDLQFGLYAEKQEHDYSLISWDFSKTVGLT